MTSVRAVVRDAAIFLFYLALAVALTWPLATNLSTAVADRGDPLLNAWIIDWVCHALTHAPLHLFDAPIFHPAMLPLALSEHMTGVALLVLPFHLAGVGAVSVYNIAILLSFAISGYGAFVLARLVMRDRQSCLSGQAGLLVPQVLAGIFYAFVSFKFDHLSHVQIIASGWIPLTLAALLAFWRSGRATHASLFAAAFAMNGLTNVYWLLFTTFAVAMTILFLEITGHPFHRRRLAFALCGAAIVLLPFLVPYRIVSNEYRMKRSSIESRGGSATWDDWLAASPSSLLYGREGAGHAERHLFPGLLPIALAAFAFLPLRVVRPRLKRPFAIAAVACSILGIALVPLHRSDVPFTMAVALALASLPVKKLDEPEKWVAVIWVAIGVIGSFGENSFLHSFLFRVFEPLHATRTPARWAIIAYCGLAVLAAIGASKLPRLRVPLLALSIVEVLARITWQRLPAEFPPVYHWLAQNRPACAIELPIGWDETEAYYVLASTIHRVPIMNGISGFDPPLHEALRKHAYDDAMLDLIARNGATVVVIHPTAEERSRAWVDRGRLREIVRFADGDAVYAINPRM